MSATVAVATAVAALLVAVGSIFNNRRQSATAAKAVAVQTVVAETSGYETQFKILSGTVATLDKEVARQSERNESLEALWANCRKREERIRQYLLRRDPAAMDELFGDEEPT